MEIICIVFLTVLFLVVIVMGLSLVALMVGGIYVFVRDIRNGEI